MTDTTTRLTVSQTSRLWAWFPPEDGCGPEWDALLDALGTRMVGRRTVALTVDEAQVFAIYMDTVMPDDAHPADRRLLDAMNRRAGW